MQLTLSGLSPIGRGDIPRHSCRAYSIQGGEVTVNPRSSSKPSQKEMPCSPRKRRTSAQLREKKTTSASATNSSSPSRPGFSTSILTLALGSDRLSHWMHCNVVAGIRPCACVLECRALPNTFSSVCVPRSGTMYRIRLDPRWPQQTHQMSSQPLQHFQSVIATASVSIPSVLGATEPARRWD